MLCIICQDIAPPATVICMLRGHTAAVCGERCVLSARTSLLHVAWSHTVAVCGECCVLSARTLLLLPQSSVCCVVTQRPFVVSVVYYLPGHCPSFHSHLYASWSHTAAVCGEYYVLCDCHRVLQTSMGKPWSWGILGWSLCQMINK